MEVKKFSLISFVFLLIFVVACENKQPSVSNTSTTNNAATAPVKYKKYDYHVTANYIKPQVLANYNKAIETNPDNPDLYNARAATKFLMKDFKGTIEDCNKAIQLKKDMPYPYYYRALSKQELGDNPGALQDLKTTKSLLLENEDKTLLNLVNQQINQLSSE